MTLKGNTREFPLDTLVRLFTDMKKTGELSLRGASGEGALGFAEGKVVAAVHGEEAPIPALGAVFEMGESEFEFTPWNDPPPANLEGDLNDNLRKAKEHREWLASVREVIPSDRTRFRLSERAAEQGAVTFTSDRWRVVLAVNGERNVTDIASNLRIERDNALNILAGLVRDGVIDAIEPPANAAPPAPSPPRAADIRMPSAPAPEPPPMRAAPPEPPPPAPEPVYEAPPPPAFTMPEPPPVSAPPSGPSEWSAPAPAAPEPEPVAPPAPAEWSMPAETRAPEPSAPEPAPPSDWGAMPTSAPVETPREQPAPADWGTYNAPSSQPAPPAAPAPSDWSTPASASPDWSAPAAPAPTPPPASAPSQPADASAPSMDDRLAALFGQPAPSPTPAAAPETQQWNTTSDWGKTAPVPDTWGTPEAAAAPQPDAAPAADPRLAALSMPIPEAAPAPAPMPQSTAQSAETEWAPPAEAPAPKKKGLFGGLFGGGAKAQPAGAPAAAAPAMAPARGASSRPARVAAFANALLAEYASGQYGKAKIDDKMASLLMRVDEQADPIDRPLPVIDDRLDVESLERVAIPDQQATPYLAMLVSTIYADAEKAFGKDKAKRGYKVAQQQVFGADASALSGPELAGKLPKV